jgi:lipid A 3-O-deacylase
MRLTARVLIPILITPVIVEAAIGAQLSTFTNEQEAQQHCPADTVVWLNLPTLVYYQKGQPSYERAKNGAYVCEREANENRARADGWSHLSILEENDSLFFNSDKHYTQGARLSLLGPEPARDSFWSDGFRLLSSISPFFASADTPAAPIRRESVFVGQSIFTPKNKAIVPPDPHDRPYAGWFYVGTSLLQETGLRQETGEWGLGILENAELDIGLVGPGALGKQVQNNFHQFIGDPPASGWSSQLQNEPGAVLSYERLWRQGLIGSNAFGVDIVPQVGASVGNIFTYGDVGGLLRIGRGLLADYGPIRVRPALSGTDYFDPNGLDNGTSFYFFAGVQGRIVGRNIFLDGNSFRPSPSVPKKNLVGDVQGGFSVLWTASSRLDVSVSLRSEEFYGQRTPDDICIVALAVTW